MDRNKRVLFLHLSSGLGMTETDLTATTREVWNNYVDLTTTRRIFYALIDRATYAPLRIVAYGRQGSGKTTFLYYAMKVAYTLYLCHGDGVRKEDCLGHAMDRYKLCLGRDCPRDGVDDRLLPGFYVTVDDLTRRFLNDVTTGEIAKRAVVFLDDALVPRLWWNLGGYWRELYYTAKTFDQYYRDHVNVLVLTAPSLTYFSREYIVNSLVLLFDARILDGHPYTIAIHFRYPHHARYVHGDTHLMRLKQIDFVDKVPHREPFGLPVWLEEANTERRRFVLREVAERAMKAMEKERKRELRKR